jgi:hypothetical protein
MGAVHGVAGSALCCRGRARPDIRPFRLLTKRVRQTVDDAAIDRTVRLRRRGRRNLGADFAGHDVAAETEACVAPAAAVGEVAGGAQRCQGDAGAERGARVSIAGEAGCAGAGVVAGDGGSDRFHAQQRKLVAQEPGATTVVDARLSKAAGRWVSPHLRGNPLREIRFSPEAGAAVGEPAGPGKEQCGTAISAPKRAVSGPLAPSLDAISSEAAADDAPVVAQRWAGFHALNPRTTPRLARSCTRR